MNDPDGNHPTIDVVDNDMDKTGLVLRPMREEKTYRRRNFALSGEQIFLLAILALFLFFLYEVASYPEDPRTFPLLVIVATLVLTGGKLLFGGLGQFFQCKTGGANNQGDHESLWRDKRRALRTWISIGLSLLVGFIFGFIFFIPVFFIAYVLLLGRRKMLTKVIFLSLGSALVVYLLFDRFLQIPTVRGVLGGW